MTPVEGMEVMVGGMVVDFSSRDSKRGGKFGILKIQDYSGAHEFMLFEQNYYDYHKYGVAGTPIYIKGVFARRFQSQDLRFKITDIRLLNEQKGQLIKGVTINVVADTLSEALLGVLDEHIQSSTDNLGNLRFRVMDPKSNRQVTLDTSTKLSLNKELIDKLENLDVEFSVEKV